MLTRPDQFLRVLFKLAEIWHQKSNHLKVAERKKEEKKRPKPKMVKLERARESGRERAGERG